MNFNADSIFSIDSKAKFEEAALDVFKFQSENCILYREFISHLRIDAAKIKSTNEIPFLPVSFFKTHKIISHTAPTAIIFSSSATTGMVQSLHHVTDLQIYEESYLRAFELFYGSIESYCIIALLPAYQEREGSSLIYMVDDLITKSRHAESGYFLNDNPSLFKALTLLKNAGQKTILIGVTYALLDFIESYTINFPDLIVMETGGMKGKRQEIIRAELHAMLCKGFGVLKIHSEYGMTELLSQGYSTGDGIFACPPWMQINIRDINDPLTLLDKGKTGGINVIDLANLNSCAFIATQDLGRIVDENSFEILGRFDNSDIRGCNLLVQ